jgi:hypothetical protein
VNNLKNLGLACLNYESAKKYYPPSSTIANDISINGLSWCVLVLPYIEEGGINDSVKTFVDNYRQANAGKDPDVYNAGFSAANLAGLTLFQCPSDIVNEIVDKFNSTYKSGSYAGVLGSYKTRPGGLPCASSYTDPNYLKSLCVTDINIDGVLFPGGSVKVRSSKITDGTSKTLMVGERWYQLRVWTAGNYYGVKQGGGINAAAPTAVPVGSYSSSAKNISWNIPPNPDLNAVGYYLSHDNTTDRPTMPASGQKTLGFNDLPFASRHAGIVNFVRADGGTEAIADNIDPAVYTGFASRNGGEVFSP